MNAGDPGLARNDRADPWFARNRDFTVDAALEFRADDRFADEGLADFQLSFRVHRSHAGGATRAGRRAVDLTRPDRASVESGEGAVLHDGQRGEQSEGDVIPIGIFRMAESELLIR